MSKILNKIENEREGFDIDKPDSKVWENIHQELHPDKKKQGFPWLKLAAVFVVSLGTIWYFKSNSIDENKEVAQVETYIDTSELENGNIDSARVPFPLYKKRKIARGGGWKDISYYLQPGHRSYETPPYSEQETGPGYRPFRGNVFKKQVAENDVTNLEKSNVGFRNVQTHIGRTVSFSNLYMDQTEITNNEYRDFVAGVRNQPVLIEADGRSGTLGEAGSGSYTYTWDFGSGAPVCVGSSITLNGSYNVTVTDVNGCVATNSPGYGYDFQHDLNPDFVYVNGNAVMRNGRSPYTEEQQQEISSGYYYEQYDEFAENEFVKTMEEAVSTFGIDVDGAGYSNMRRYINNGFLPPKDAVKLEEMINYFEYKLPEPKNNRPFAVTTELGACPWNEKNQLFQICMKGKSIAQEEFPASNLVFLIDVSGSMDEANKLPLLKQGFKMLVKNLREKDKVSIVVYAGAAGLVLPTTSGKNKEKILEAIDNLNAGGSTAGGEGIMLAYDIAKKNFITGGNNRIILATDGDFNVGVSDDDALIRLVEEKRKTGVFISVLGFGEGNLQASKMEKIADNGNGNYSYIDQILEAKKVLVSEMGGTLHTIAKDVKLQLEFNPKQVKSYRLLGYENRMLATEDFENDLKDAGDLGSGHTIVALYEIVPADGEKEAKSKLKYQSTIFNDDEELEKELLTLKFRYKEPDGEKSKLMTYVIKKKLKENMSENFRFASAVAEFGLLIRESEYKGDASFEKLIERAQKSKGDDLKGYRSEFIQLAEKGEILFNDYHSSK